MLTNPVFTQTLCSHKPYADTLEPLPRGTLTIPRVFAVKKGLLRKPPQSERKTTKALPEATLAIHRVFTVSRGPGRKPPQSERGSRSPSQSRPLRSTVFSQSLEASGANRRRVSEGPGGGPYFSTDFFEDVRSGMPGRTKKCRRGVHFERRGRRTAIGVLQEIRRPRNGQTPYPRPLTRGGAGQREP